MIAQLEVAEIFDPTKGFFAQMDERYRKRRQRAPLAADPTLADCFGLLTKGDMVGVARATMIGSVTAMRKAALYDYMVQVYANPAFLKGLVEQLNPSERAALQDLLDHGGVMVWQTFTADPRPRSERPTLFGVLVYPVGYRDGASAGPRPAV